MHMDIMTPFMETNQILGFFTFDIVPIQLNKLNEKIIILPMWFNTAF